MTTKKGPHAQSLRNSRTDVLNAAARLLNSRGLPGLSMRNLAAELGVRPSALYWHFPDKQTLLAALSARVLAPAASATSTFSTFENGAASWEDALRCAAADLRDALLSVPDGAELVSSSLALGLVSLPLDARLRPALTRAGGSDHVASVVCDTLSHFVLGHTYHEQQRLAAEQAGVLVNSEAHDRSPIAPPASRDDVFASGVDLIVAGTAVVLTLDQVAS